MPLVPGARLGPYEILAPLGAGGMGEVWRARDTKLAREVALKVLPDHLSNDPKALARFEGEAKTVAALSHPGILAIHDFGRISGVSFAVTELLEGATLRDALRTGPMPCGKALDVATQVAEGLAAAHEKGVVHRDVKPENVFLTRDGHARLLDFGLARHDRSFRGAEDTRSPTVSERTEAGGVVGTVAYMSPEQSRGLPVDARSDQFSFGVLLYEMLAGRRPFHGETAAETITSILREEPESLRTAAPGVPPPVRWIVERCLAKEPSDRFTSTTDLARDLATCHRNLSELPSRGPAPAVAGGPAGTSRIALRAALAAAAALALFASGVAFERSRARERAPGAVPRLVRLTWEPGLQSLPSVSPDGGTFAYVSGPPGNLDIFVRRIGGENPVNLTRDCPDDDTMPSFSPDGQSIAFRSDRDGGGIFVMGATGESVRRLTDFGYEPAWSPDGRSIVFGTFDMRNSKWEETGVLWTVDVATGARRKLFDGDAVSPTWSPSGSRIAFHRFKGVSRGTALATIPASGGQPVDLVDQSDFVGAGPDWTRDGIWFCSLAGGIGNIWRVRVDEATGALLGAPEQVTTSTTGLRYPSRSTDGRRLLFTSVDATRAIVRWELDVRRGVALPGRHVVLSGPRYLISPRPSPDGEWLAMLLFEQDIADLVLVRTRTGETRRLTNDAPHEDYFAWSADGSRIFYTVTRGQTGEVWSLRPDGSGRERVLAAPDREDFIAPVPSPDGRWMYVGLGVKPTKPTLVDLGAPFAERRLVPLPPMDGGRRYSARGWSPDGRWLVGYPQGAADEVEPVLTLFDVARKEYGTLVDLGAENGCAWLPDSRRILLWRKGNLRVLDRETGALTPAGSVEEDVVGRLWLSRDGRTLAGTTATLDGDVWMLEGDLPRR